MRDALPGADLFYCETIVNPTTHGPGSRGARRACAARPACSRAVDNTFASPYLCNPVTLGFDVALHSATKYIGGHADLIGGVSPAPTRSSSGELRDTVIDLGGTMQPLEAWLVLRGLATLALRMEHHCASAGRLAEALAAHPSVERVHYPGLASHPQHELAARQLRGFGGTLAFEVAGGLEAGSRVAEALELGWIGGSLGSVMTLVAHPASTTHRQVDPEAAGPRGSATASSGWPSAWRIRTTSIEDFTRALEKA